MDTNKIAELQEIIDIAEKCKNAYFWSPEGCAGGRRAKEKQYSREIEWTEGGHEWTARTSMEQSCKNVYFRTEYTRDGKKTNLTAVRNSLKRMIVEANAFCKNCIQYKECNAKYELLYDCMDFNGKEKN